MSGTPGGAGPGAGGTVGAVEVGRLAEDPLLQFPEFGLGSTPSSSARMWRTRW